MLDGVGLEIRRGEVVALVGRSGCGKTTLASLLLGLRRPDAGSVTVDGVDLAGLDLAAWRRQVSWVPQRPTLFHGTVAHNIALGADGVTGPRLERAARQAGADEFVRELPQGYDTTIGEGGRGLSAGQTRRIALARALVRDAPLLILDEPTADLDAESAAVIVAAIGEAREGRAVLVIEHRPALARLADRVVRLADGKAVVERGDGDHVKTLLELLRLSRLPRARVAASVVLGTLAVLSGVGLMAFAGYLISRAAERPPVLSLGVVIVAVRFFGLARPLTRYLERLTSHDLAFRLLARMRVAFFARLEPLVPARLEGYRRGDLLARMVGDVDALQNLFLRGLTPPLVALLSGAVSVAVCAAFLPAAGLVLAAGLLAGGVVVPIVAALAGRRSGARQAGARAELTVELVELLRGAPELVVLGADQAVLARVAALDARADAAGPSRGPGVGRGRRTRASRSWG